MTSCSMPLVGCWLWAFIASNEGTAENFPALYKAGGDVSVEMFFARLHAIHNDHTVRN